MSEIDFQNERSYGQIVILLTIPVYVRDEVFEAAVAKELELIKKESSELRKVQLQRVAQMQEKGETYEVN